MPWRPPEERLPPPRPPPPLPGPDAIRERVQALLAASGLPRQRQREGKTVTYDLRPLVLELTFAGIDASEGIDGARQEARLRMRLTATPQGQGRPEEVAGALGLRATRVHRLALGLAPPDAEPEAPPAAEPPRRSLELRRPPDPLPQVPAVGHLLGPPAARRRAGRSSRASSRCPCSARRRAAAKAARAAAAVSSPRAPPAPSPPVCATKPALPLSERSEEAGPRQRLRVAQPAEGRQGPPQQVTRRLLAPRRHMQPAQLQQEAGS